MAKAEVLPVTLTGPRYETLVMAQKFIEDYGYSPTARELTRMMGYASVSTVHDHLNNLRRGGFVDWLPHAARTLRITQNGKAALTARGVL